MGHPFPEESFSKLPATPERAAQSRFHGKSHCSVKDSIGCLEIKTVLERAARRLETV
jgi:hypothetical protein